MNSPSTAPCSIRQRSTPFMNAMSPPTATWKKSSITLVPNSELRTSLGTQYRSSPGSRIGLTTITRVPSRLAWARYFIVTGWLLARCDPMITTRSLPIMSLSEQVGAATPSVSFNPATLAAWQSRAHRST
jgi:hypothetical protein